MTNTPERGTYERERREHEDPSAPMPLGPNTLGGGGSVIVPPVVEDQEQLAEDVANQTADPIKERAHHLRPGQEYKEISQHNAAGEALVSEIQRETGISGGAEPHVQPGQRAVGVGASAHSEGGRCTLFDEPRSDGVQLGTLLEGTHLVLIEGPRQAQGEEWWSVQLPDGRTGWMLAACLGPDPFPSEETSPIEEKSSTFGG